VPRITERVTAADAIPTPGRRAPAPPDGVLAGGAALFHAGCVMDGPRRTLPSIRPPPTLAGTGKAAVEAAGCGLAAPSLAPVDAFAGGSDVAGVGPTSATATADGGAVTSSCAAAVATAGGGGGGAWAAREGSGAVIAITAAADSAAAASTIAAKARGDTVRAGWLAPPISTDAGRNGTPGGKEMGVGMGPATWKLNGIGKGKGIGSNGTPGPAMKGPVIAMGMGMGMGMEKGNGGCKKAAGCAACGVNCVVGNQASARGFNCLCADAAAAPCTAEAADAAGGAAAAGADVTDGCAAADSEAVGAGIVTVSALVPVEARVRWLGGAAVAGEAIPRTAGVVTTAEADEGMVGADGDLVAAVGVAGTPLGASLPPVADGAVGAVGGAATYGCMPGRVGAGL